MPKYDYRCEHNGQTVEVSHSMNDSINTWGELCQRAGIDRGATPADSTVHKIISGGFVATGSASAPAPSHACTTSACCGGICPADG